MTAGEKVALNSFVSFECTLRNEAGEIIEGDDESDEALGASPASSAPGSQRIEYVHGYGMLVPGLETALFGLVVGDEREVLVPAESAYGEWDKELVMEVERADFPEPEKVEVGDELVAEFPDGGAQAMRVVEVRDDSVVVDANHPLAGMALRYSVKVHLVRPATDEEVEKAARELAESEEEDHVHGPGCSHESEFDDEDVSTEQLITLGRKGGAPN
jgi:FKBP-type peptidyl-prolyl cis-trans isomerase SlyD